MRLTCSEICKQNFGRNPSDPFTYEELIEAIVPAERERMQISVKEAVENRSDYEHEYRIVTPMGESRWIMARGRVH
jgi:hypothetical protein